MPESVNFDRAAEFYDATRTFAPGQIEPAIRTIAGAGAFHTQTNALEIGIGTGRIGLPLSAHVGAYYGVDISTGMMGKLREKPGGERVTLAEADAMHLPFASHSFDAVVISHVFHLVADAEQVARELQRVLKPDGIALHCYSSYGDGLAPIRDVWEQATANNRRVTGRWQKSRDLLVSMGWTKSAQHAHTYPTVSRPGEFLERVQSRAWSSTWDMDDEAHAAGVAAVQQAIEAHYGGDLDHEIPGEGVFYVEAFRLPSA